MHQLFAFAQKKIRLHLPLWLVLLLPFAAYLIWEIYWFTQVGLRVVKWHTHVAQYAYVWLAGVFLFRVFAGSSFSERAKNIFLLFTSVVIALGILETALQFTGTTKTYMEKVSGEFSSPYSPQDATWYHAWATGKPHYITKPEYSFWRPTNSLGLPDSEWTVRKSPKQKRLLALGDSFTEGDGAAYDSSYVWLLKQKFFATGDSFEVMNGGVCGSDPFNNYVILRDKLLPYQPDIILQVLATNDLNTDIFFRGGMERFQKNGSQKYASAPWWEPVYAISYISRVFFKLAGYNELLQRGAIESQKQNELNSSVNDLFKQYSALCFQHHIKLIVLLRPDRREIENNKYEYDFAPILNPLKADSTVVVIDLLPAYQNYIAKDKHPASDYFWKHDGHHNATGYQMMAQCVYENVLPLLKDSTAEKK